MAQMSVDDIARNFVYSYYQTLDKKENRVHLASVYRDCSCMQFEGVQFHGTTQIMEKLMCLPEHMDRVYSSMDAMPLPDGTLLVNVMGQQKTDQENDHPLAFIHTFILGKEDTNIVITKEIFRLVLHNV